VGRRWKWFLRPGVAAIDLTGQTTPNAGNPGQYQRRTVEHFVPEVRLTSRCDGSIVYQLPEQPETPRETWQGTGRYDRKPPNQRNRRSY
jgi:hypothetical protein